MAGNREVRKKYAKKAMDEIWTIETEFVNLEKLQLVDLKTLQKIDYAKLQRLRKTLFNISRLLKEANFLLSTISGPPGYYFQPVEIELETGTKVNIELSVIKEEHPDFKPYES